MRSVSVRLKDGTTVVGDDFDMKDYETLKEIFHKLFRSLNKKTRLRGCGLCLKLVRFTDIHMM